MKFYFVNDVCKSERFEPIDINEILSILKRLKFSNDIYKKTTPIILKDMIKRNAVGERVNGEQWFHLSPENYKLALTLSRIGVISNKVDKYINML